MITLTNLLPFLLGEAGDRMELAASGAFLSLSLFHLGVYPLERVARTQAARHSSFI